MNKNIILVNIFSYIQFKRRKKSEGLKMLTFTVGHIYKLVLKLLNFIIKLDLIGFFMVICFPPSALRVWRTFHLVLNFFRSVMAGQIIFLEFIKDGPADNRIEFTYGGLANQTVIL